jgi:hypothetical protein
LTLIAQISMPAFHCPLHACLGIALDEAGLNTIIKWPEDMGFVL